MTARGGGAETLGGGGQLPCLLFMTECLLFPYHFGLVFIWWVAGVPHILCKLQGYLAGLPSIQRCRAQSQIAAPV